MRVRVRVRVSDRHRDRVRYRHSDRARASPCIEVGPSWNCVKKKSVGETGATPLIAALKRAVKSHPSLEASP